MAGGFDAVATGLLSGINNNIEQQRKQAQTDLNEGDKAQFEAFQNAAKEYDAAKTKTTQDQQQIEEMAKMIAAHSGKPIGPWAYATARDAVENKYTNVEHLPYVFDAAERTYQDQQKNPERWNVTPDTAPTPGTFRQLQDSDPANTATLQKFNPNLTATDAENVRQHNNPKPYGNLPGSSWGNPEDIANKQTYDKERNTAQAKQDVENSAMGWGDSGSFGGNGPSGSGQAPQQQPAQQPSQQGGNSFAVPASQLDPNAKQPPQNGPIPPPAGPQQGQQPQQQGQLGNPQQQQPQSNGIDINAPAPPDYTAANHLVPNTGTTRGEQVTGMSLNTEFLQSLPPAIQGQVKGIAEGTVRLPPGFGGAAAAYRAKLLGAVKQYDPTFDETTFQARASARAALDNPNSKVGQQIISINRLAQHLDKLDQSIDKLPNLHAYDSDADWNSKGMPGTTGLENRIGRMEAGWSGGKDQQAYTTFNTNKKAVVDEMTRLWRGTGGNKSDIEERAKELDSAGTPEELHAALKASVGLIQGQIDPLQSSMDRVLGLHTRDILTPKSREVYDRISGDKELMQGQQGSDNQIDTNRPQAEASAPVFKSLAEVPPTTKIFRDTDGNLMLNPNYKGQ